MAKGLVPDALWDRVEPLIPAEPPKPQGGRPRLDDRACLTGIIFVLKSGIPWELLPQEMGCGSGMTCWRRLRDWQAAGVWDALEQTLRDELGVAGGIDWSRACLDSASIPAKKGGRRQGRIRPIVANRGRSARSSPTVMASRSPSS
jgi:transposase